CSKNEKYHIKSHHLRIQIQPYGQNLFAIDSIQLEYFRPTESIHFLLGEKFSIDAARVGNQELTVKQVYVHNLESLGFQKQPIDFAKVYKIILPKSLYPEHIEIRYHGPIDQAQVSNDDNNFGSLLTPDLVWYPEFPRSLCGYKLTAESDLHRHSISCGEARFHNQERDSLYNTWQQIDPVGSVFYLTGSFDVHYTKHNNTDIFVYKALNSSFPSVSYAATASSYLDYFSRKFGSYPFSSLTILEDASIKDVPIPSLSILPSHLIKYSAKANVILCRDICASWWGNSVVPVPGQGNWREGLLTFCSEYLPLEERSSQLAKRYRYSLLSDYYSANITREKEYALDRFQEIRSPKDSAIGQAKGMMLFYQLGQIIGSENMQIALEEFYTQYAHGYAGWSDFQEVFERISGKNLKNFFSQWLHQKGAPELTVKNISTKKQNGSYALNFTLAQKQNRPFFKLDIPIKISTENGVVYDSCKLEKRQKDYSVVTQNPVQKLEIDPDYQIFRRLHPGEFSPSLKQFNHYPAKLIISGSSASHHLMKKLFHTERLPVIQFQEISQYNLSEYAILAVDLSNEQLFKLGYIHSDSIRYSEKELTVYDQKFNRDDECVIFALINRQNPYLPVIGIWYKTEHALEHIVRPIESFGEYGFVVFRNGQNIFTGNWDIQNNPLSVYL
ncbi:hypothetical protein JW935_11165, partial [candidate division KSB1 bacterium]|nr:hypothetical protein [candidate division KSB1 bacterium]